MVLRGIISGGKLNFIRNIIYGVFGVDLVHMFFTQVVLR